MCVCVCAFSDEAVSEHFATLRTVAHQFLCPRNFPGKNAGVCGLFFSRGLPDRGTELTSPGLAGGFFTTKSPGKHVYMHFHILVLVVVK